ncbi:MAG: PmoA family protein, partial [Pirellulales bacterium]
DTVQSGAPGVIVTSNDWIGPHGRKILEDQRTLRFDTDGDSRWIDFDVTMTANDKPVRFGDTKEGSLGIRVAGTMKVEAQPGGQIVNSEGHKDEQAWGKAAAWVDYHGPVDGKTVGIAILNHPNSFRHPTYWHVRTYGLLAANPFGLNDFTSGAKQGSYTLPAGESITLRYRILLHQGDQVEGKVAEAYAAYAATKPDGNVKPSSDE